MSRDPVQYTQIHSLWALVDALWMCGKHHESDSLKWYINNLPGGTLDELNTRITELQLEVI